MELMQISDLVRDDGNLQTWSGIGGYSITFLDRWENVMCGDCASEAFCAVNNDLKGGFIHWEGEPLSCIECGDEIPSEYGDVGKIQSDMAEHARKNIRKEAPWILGE